MEKEDLKKCQYCAEMIKKEAVKCQYCGSKVNGEKANVKTLFAEGYWHRVWTGRKIAGVCTGLAHQFGRPETVLPIRLLFVLATLFYGLGPIVYILLWIMMPSPIDVPEKMAESDEKSFTPEKYWQRVWKGKKIAGVCTGLSHQFKTPKLLLPMRLFFVLTSFIFGLGIALYLLMWILMPGPADIPDYKICSEDDEGELIPYRKKAKLLSVLFGFVLLFIGSFFLFTTTSFLISYLEDILYELSIWASSFFHRGISMEIFSPEIWSAVISSLGLIFIILGGLKLAFGSSKIVRVER